MQAVANFFSESNQKSFMYLACLFTAIFLIAADANFTNRFLSIHITGTLPLVLFRLPYSWLGSLLISLTSTILLIVMRNRKWFIENLIGNSKADNAFLENAISWGFTGLTFILIAGVYTLDFGTTYAGVSIPASERLGFISDWSQAAGIYIGVKHVVTMCVVFGGSILMIVSRFFAK